MGDDADHLLPGGHFLGVDLARELLEQQQPVRQRIEQEASLRDVIDLGLAADFEREQGVATPFDGLTQRPRCAFEVLREPGAFELAALGKQPACARVAVEHDVGVVGQHQRQGRGLDHGVEHELALVEALAFDPQPVAEPVVIGHQLARARRGWCRSRSC